MWRLLSVFVDLLLTAFSVCCLLLAYGRIGKPEGADPTYDAWFKQWPGTYKVIGWLGVVCLMLGLIVALLPGW